ncbi:hypothetical protein BKA70DRAFT_1137123 [Coprinopsis sp. MPI-PUGE-AT-0042]|nr:hypothetical protein BKA70DRAFT_1137123 [Coprinopsis sp. MPI-PUGE-AT-0042]
MPTIETSRIQSLPVTTTTFYGHPPYTADPLPTDTPPRVPVAAIAGGVVAGALLAIAATIGWIWWGRSLDRSVAKDRREAATRANTLRNSHISRPKVQTRYRPFNPNAVEKQVKFSDEHNGEETPDAVQLPRRPSRAQRFITRFQTEPKESVGGEGGHPRAPGMEHQPSRQTMSSVSQYSTASGEEHQYRAPSNSLLAALGMSRSSSGDPNADDTSSRRWSWSSSNRRQNRTARNAQRTSQATQFSSTTDGSGRVVTMGVAL